MSSPLGPVDIQDIREQYATLREEIISLSETMRSTESLILTLTGAAFAWLVANPTYAFSGWWLLLVLPLLGAMRNSVLAKHIGVMAAYLVQLEIQLFPAGSPVPGWEHHLKSNGGKRELVSSDTAFWVVLCVAAALGGLPLYHLSKKVSNAAQSAQVASPTSEAASSAK